MGRARGLGLRLGSGYVKRRRKEGRDNDANRWKTCAPPHAVCGWSGGPCVHATYSTLSCVSMGHLLATSMMAASVSLSHPLRVRGGGGGGDGRALVLLVPSAVGRSGEGLGLRLRLGSGHVKRRRKEGRDGDTNGWKRRAPGGPRVHPTYMTVSSASMGHLLATSMMAASVSLLQLLTLS